MKRGDYKMNHGKALSVIRAAKGLQQKELAELLGVTPSYISRVEKGERPMSKKMVDVLSKKTAIPQDLYYLIAQDHKNLAKQDGQLVEKLSYQLLKIITKG